MKSKDRKNYCRLIKTILLVGLFVTICGTGTVQAASQYTNDGILSAREEFARWYVNRARYAPEQEADRFGLTNSSAGGHPGYDVCEDTNGVNDFGTTVTAWAKWTNSLGPVAPNARLHVAASNHCRDMYETVTFQHLSPSTNYYPLNSSPTNRWAIEGYVSTINGYIENISMGVAGQSGSYPSDGLSPSNAFLGLFIDASDNTRGHRCAILNPSALEIGAAHVRFRLYSAPFYKTYDYYTEDYAGNTNHFFTDTIFYSTNSNHAYDEGEGVSNITIRLYDGVTEGSWYDVSEAAGSFAIPIMPFDDGHTITVQLSNNATARQLTIPTGFNSDTNISLGSRAVMTLGTFVQPVGRTNVGLRNIAIVASLDSNHDSNGVPRVWYESYGLTNYMTDGMTDTDGDGALAWEEYRAGTVPTNRDSVFHVTSILITGNVFNVIWYGTTNSGVTNAFGVLRCTNLIEGKWTNVSPALSRSSSGTNEWLDHSPPPANTPVFYRPFITTNGN
ncbi:MAG: hypothetical protein WCN95_02905 [bacterium]